MLRINTLDGHQRMSTQELLQTVSSAVENGETEFCIAASGQHDIGGPLWNREGRDLHFNVSNPGQRAGCMCMPGTRVTVEGPAPADVGWLNSGGTIIIKGDAGDTAGHCAAAGKIFIGGRAGTRSGSLMKHDPECGEPELWILKSTGSFSFEFMGGGRAVVCGHDCLAMPSVLGERPGVGMVGGIVYFRGSCSHLCEDVEILPLDEDDITWLSAGLDNFLDAIGAMRLKKDLSIWKLWHKLVPATDRQATRQRMSVAQFRKKSWLSGGIFGDILQDNHEEVAPLVPTGRDRLKQPVWENEHNGCLDCRACLTACPQAAVRRRKAASQQKNDEAAIYSANDRRCIGCGICVAVCPAKVWHLETVQP